MELLDIVVWVVCCW